MFSDPTIWVRFEMPPGQRAVFLAGTRCAPTFETWRAPPRAERNDPPVDWWDPERFEVLDTTSVPPDVNPGQDIWFGQTDSGNDVVYVYAYHI